MERPLKSPVGTPTTELDTPALVVDVRALAANIEQVHSFFRERPAKIRPLVTAHRCPAVAHLQAAAGGTSGGIAVSTLAAARIFAAAGFNDILIVTEIVSPAKIAELCALAHECGAVAVAADDPRNVRRLSDAAARAGVEVGVVADLDVGYGRSGVATGKPLSDLVRSIVELPGLRFAGLLGLETEEPLDDAGAQAKRSAAALDTVSRAVGQLKADGLEAPAVATGCTADYRAAGSRPEVTEVLAGAYCLMDSRHVPHVSGPVPAARILTTIASRPEAGIAISDCGHKAIGGDTGLPVAEEVDGAELAKMSAEHGIFELSGKAQSELAIGDTVWLTPHDGATAVNSYDLIHVARDGKLEAVWDVSARGAYH